MACHIMKLALIGLMIPILITEAIVNSKVDRIIDLSTQLVKITEKISLEDVPNPSEPYIVLLDSIHRSKLAFIDAKINGQALRIVEKSTGNFEVNLEEHDFTKHPLVITSIFTRILIPHPAEISQNERQLVQYQGYQTSLSPYLTKTITTRIKLPQSSRLESFTKASKMTTGSNKLTYGPFKDVRANEAEPMSIHYENNTPFVAVTHLLRKVEVCPWANSINIVNEVKVAHVGAKLKGPFSRFEYQRDNTNSMSSVRSFDVELPKSSSDIYFRDGIGNISTSGMRTTSAKTVVTIRPRFPLFGGWMTDFVLGYAVPLSQYIKEPTTSSKYSLNIPFSDILYESMFIDDATLKIYLPAGSSDIEVEENIGTERLLDDKHYKYLDVIGRPVITLKKTNIVAQHLDGRPLIVKYNYSKMYMLQEPILIMAALFVTIIMAAVYSRMPMHCNTKSKLD